VTLTHAPSRLQTALFGPLSQPRLPGDLAYYVARENRRSLRLALVVLVLVGALGLALVAVSSSLEGAEVGLLVTFVGAPVSSALARMWFLRRRALPAGQVLAWQADQTMRDWRAIDGQNPPTTLAEALDRLSGRSGDLESATRIGYLIAGEENRDAARQALAGWSPSDPAFRARRERLASILAFADDVDDLSAAKSAIDLVGDESDRRTQQALLLIEEARRLAIHGSDPLPVLVRARGGLAQIDLPILRSRTRRSRREMVVRAPLRWALGVVLVFVFASVFAVFVNLILTVVRSVSH